MYRLTSIQVREIERLAQLQDRSYLKEKESLAQLRTFYDSYIKR